MKTIKSVLSLVLAAAMLLSFAACTGGVPKNTVFSADDLPGKKIGVQLGTTGDIYASDYEEEGSTIERYTKTTDAVQALKQGKIDCIIIDEAPAKVFVEKNSDLTILNEPFEIEEYAICVSKDNPELTASINEALNQLKADGTLDKIIGNYIGTDSVGTFQYKSTNTDYSNGKLVMATEATFPPYEFVEDGIIKGIDVDIVQAVADILKKELVVEDMAFDSIIAAVQSGKADIGAAGMTITEDRLQNVDFTEPYTTATQVIIVRKK